MNRRSKLQTALGAVVFLSAMRLHAAPPPVWTATWGSSQILATGADALPKEALNGATLRQVVHLSLGGKAVRLHLSNEFGEAPLELHTVTVSNSGSGKSPPAVLFNGQAKVSIPAGAEYFSDPIALSVDPLSDLTITLVIDKAPDRITLHSGSRATSFLLTANREAAPQALLHWYFIAGVEVEAAPGSRSLVALGDSITDGHAATNDANNRWTDVLARRLAPMGVAVVNEGIGGNRLLDDGLGPNALARFDRDVLSVAGAHYLIVLEGINDLGVLDRLQGQSEATHAAFIEKLESAFRQMIERGHAHGIRVYGATIMPDTGSDYYHPGQRSEAARQAVNQWIRSSGVFDGVVDFDQVMRDPTHPDRLAPAFDSGDHLHPGPAGYQRMGESVPLDLFKMQGDH
jgi:lysophospholipase L1-like esterase